MFYFGLSTPWILKILTWGKAGTSPSPQYTTMKCDFRFLQLLHCQGPQAFVCRSNGVRGHLILTTRQLATASATTTTTTTPSASPAATDLWACTPWPRRSRVCGHLKKIMHQDLVRFLRINYIRYNFFEVLRLIIFIENKMNRFLIKIFL